MFVKIEKMAALEHIKNLLMQVSGINNCDCSALS